VKDDHQFTVAEAVAFHDSGAWKEMTPEERFRFQLNQALLCMPFSEYHKAAEESLGRPVWTHEFADLQSLRDELDGKTRKATMADILDKIPADKRVLLVDSNDLDPEALAEALRKEISSPDPIKDDIKKGI